MLLLESCCPQCDSQRIAALLASLPDPKRLLSLAEHHGVIAQLSAAVEPLLASPDCAPLAAALRGSRKRQVLSTLALTAELLRLSNLLRADRVEAVAIKGPALAIRAYGDSSARHYGDIDLLVRHDDIRRASEILVSAGFHARVSGYELQSGKTPGQYFFRRPDSGVIVELHTERTLRYFPRRLPIDNFLQRKTAVALGARAIPALALEDEFVLISIHGAKHFWERLMWVSDVAALVHRHPQLDWRRVRQSATEVGAERMVRLALFLAERCLRVPVPAEMKREVAGDAACPRIARKIETWLPYAGHEPPPLTERALFRLRMRGHWLAGARYLTRLSLSTTEEDWPAITDSNSKASSLRESLARPFRLAKKYRRNPEA